MRLPRVHFTVRRMMVGIAVIALAVCTVQVWRRHTFYRRLAVFHAMLEAENQSYAEAWRVDAEACLRSAEWLRTKRVRQDWEAQAIHSEASYRQWLDNEAIYRNQAAQHAQLKRRYEHAARRPWALAPPEPPMVAQPDRRMKQLLAGRPESP